MTATRHSGASTCTTEAGGSSHDSWCPGRFRAALGFRACLGFSDSNKSRALLTSSEARCAASQTAACGERQWRSG